MFSGLPLAVNLLIFVALAATIWQAGTRLSYYIDAIAEKTHIARGFLGLVLLATATELPEMVTTTTAVTENNPSLALNNMFGGIMLQLCVLAIADMFVIRYTLTSHPTRPNVIVAALFSILSLSFLLMLYHLGDVALVWHVGIGTILLAMLYLLALYNLRKIEHQDIWSAVDLPNEQSDATRENRFDEKHLRTLIIYTIIAALVILVSGVLVVRLADQLAEQTGLGASFIGVSLLALTTSMPELSTCIAAVRVKAYTMAISNIFGSNLIMTFILLPVDIFYQEGPIVNQIDNATAFALSAALLLTTIYCIALLIKPKKKILGMGIDSFMIICGYTGCMYILYTMR